MNARDRKRLSGISGCGRTGPSGSGRARTRRRQRRVAVPRRPGPAQRGPGRGSSPNARPPTASAPHRAAPSQSKRRQSDVSRESSMWRTVTQRGDREERHVDQERGAPADGVDQGAPDDRPSTSAPRWTRPHAERPAALRPHGTPGRDKEERARDEQGPRRALGAARNKTGQFEGRRQPHRADVIPKPARPIA